MNMMRRSHSMGISPLIYLCLCFWFASIAPVAGGAGIPLAINELMAANSSTKTDPQGHYDDWVEIHNYSDTPIDLARMYLTDDPADPTKWQIPGGASQLTSVGPGGYLLIWLDGHTSDAGLHASFALDSDGEAIALFAPDGATPIDSVAFGPQRVDVSYGRSPDGMGPVGYLLAPTPGASNSGLYEGVVADTQFSHPRGFYDVPFQVTLGCETPDATIYYTLDGSEPYSRSRQVPAGSVYSGPILISRTTCLRAQAIKPGWLPGNSMTHTYLFPDEVATRSQSEVLVRGYPSTWYGSYPADYEMDPDVTGSPAYAAVMDDALLAIPTLSIATNKDHLFDKTRDAETGGIYIYTGHGSTGGQDWERPVSAELFSFDGIEGFQIDCGLRIQGGESRNPQKCPKHSFSLRFRGMYGVSKLRMSLFDGCPVEAFDSLQLRGFFNNSWTHWDAGQRQRAQFVRDQWMRDSLLEMGQADAGRGFYVHLYLNGIYWGLYLIQERPVASHYAAYNGGEPDRIDAINGGRATDGTAQAWQQARSLAAGKDWGRICEVIDIDNFIDFTLLNLFAGNHDLKTDGNWRAAGGGPDGKPWRFYSWDAEQILVNRNQTGTGPSSDPTGMYRSLSEIEEFRIRFGDRVHKHLFNDGALTAERNIERWTKRADEIDVAVVAESARWGSYRRDMHSWSSGPYHLYTRNDFWITERQRLLEDYFPRRNSVALSQFKSLGLYPSVEAPVFHVNGLYQHGGHVAAAAWLTMPSTAPTVWYTLDGSDPRTPGSTGSTGRELVLAPEAAPKQVFVPIADIGSAWRTDVNYDDSDWLAGTGGVGYERSTGYESFIGIDVGDAMDGRNSSCYIRVPFEITPEGLQYAGGLALKVRYDDGFIAYLNGVEVQRVMFEGTPAWNSEATANHSDLDAVEFETFDISSHISRLALGRNILAIHGLNAGATSSDFLISVELVSSEGGGNVPSGISPTAVQYSGPVRLDASARVRARARSGAAWSALNEAVYAVGPVAESLRISEIMYHPPNTGHPDDPNAEYIELVNVGSQAINLHLVRFTNGIDLTFGDVTLAPWEYAVLVKDIPVFETTYGDDVRILGQYEGRLDNAGERIELQDAAGQTILRFRYKDGWYDQTDGGGYSLTVIDPATADSATLDKKSAWRASGEVGGSPGYDDGDAPVPTPAPEPEPAPGPVTVVINELLAHSPAGTPDWIELHNTTDQAIDIGGWFLSDDAADPTKYEIPAGTRLAAGGYVVFYEYLHFGNANAPGCRTPFQLSQDGGTLHLRSVSPDTPTDYRHEVTFGPSDLGVTLGRYLSTTGRYEFGALRTATPGKANATP